MNIEPQPAVSQPRPPFQFGLRTLLLLFVVLGSSLAVFGEWGVVVFGLVVGVAIYIHQDESLSSLTFLVLVVLCLMCLIGLLLPAVQTAKESVRRVQCLSNLKEIVLALHQYEQAKGCFPPAYMADKNGRPMHSWRVLVLPYMDQSPLYAMFRFNEPWDGPNNTKLLATRLPVYECPSDTTVRTPGTAQTSYVAVVGPGTAWEGERATKFSDLGDHASHTILLVEVTNAGIAWGEPRDLSLDELVAAAATSAPQLSNNHGRQEEFFFTYDNGPGVNVAMADGSVRYLWLGNRSPEDLRKLLQIGGVKEEELGDPVRRLNWPNIAALAVWLLSVGTLLTLAVRSRKRLSVPPTPS